MVFCGPQFFLFHSRLKTCHVISPWVESSNIARTRTDLLDSSNEQQITNGKCFVFLSYMLVTSRTLDSCPKPVVNKYKILHKQPSMPSVCMGHLPHMSKTGLNSWPDINVCHSQRYLYSQIMPITRFPHIQHKFDKTRQVTRSVSPRFLIGPSVLGVCQVFSMSCVHVGLAITPVMCDSSIKYRR